MVRLRLTPDLLQVNELGHVRVGEDVVLKVDGLATAFRALEATDSKGGSDKRGQAKGANP